MCDIKCEMFEPSNVMFILLIDQMISYIVYIRLIIQTMTVTVTVTVLNKPVCVLNQIEHVQKFVANSLQKV